MITAQNVSKSFQLKGGRRRVLHGLSFSVPDDANLAILGAEASGKSTLLKLIGGLDYPDAGKIRRNGTVSWVFGNMRFERAMTISQNVRFISRVLGVQDHEGVEQKVRELTGFGRQFNSPMMMLRPLEARQLNMAISLAFSFDILLLDGMPGFNQLKNSALLEEKLDEKMSQSSVVMAARGPQEIDKRYSHILVLDGKSGQLYDNRREAVQAYKAIINDRPETVDENQSQTADEQSEAEVGNVREIRE